jgi:hypothetical protein
VGLALLGESFCCLFILETAELLWFVRCQGRFLAAPFR